MGGGGFQFGAKTAGEILHRKGGKVVFALLVLRCVRFFGKKN